MSGGSRLRDPPRRPHDRSRSSGRSPLSSDRLRSTEGGRRARRERQEGVETVAVSQAPVVSEAVAVATPAAGLRFPFLSSLASWQRLRIPLPLLLGLRAFLYRPYQTREIIAMGDSYVLCGRSGVTWTVLLHIIRSVSGCLSPQGVARRRYRRPLSPSGSGRRYHVLTSFRSRHSLCLLLELVRHMVSLRLFFSRRTSLLTKC